MFTYEQIYGTNYTEALKPLLSLVTFNEDDSVEQISANVSLLLSGIKKAEFSPNFRLNFTPMVSADNKFSHGQFKLRLLRGSIISGDNSMPYGFKIMWGKDFYSRFIDLVGEWIGLVYTTKMLEANANEITDFFALNTVGMDIRFRLFNKPIVSVSNTSIVVGLSEEVLAHATDIDVFSNDNLFLSLVANRYDDTIRSLVRPTDVFRSKSYLFKELGISTKSRLDRILSKTYRKSFKLGVVTDEPVKFEHDGMYGLIMCQDYDGVEDKDNIAYLDDNNLAYYFVLNPFNEDGVFVDDIEKQGDLISSYVDSVSVTA